MMKKISSIISTLSLLVILSCSSSPSVPDGEFLIQGKLTNVPDGVVLELSTLDGRRFNIIATDTVIGGEFMFRDTISSGVRRLHLLSSYGNSGFANGWVDIWVAPNELVEIEGENTLMKTWNVEGNVQEQKEENAFMGVTFPEIIEDERLSAMVEDLFKLYDRLDGDKIIRAKIDSVRELQNPLQEIIGKKQLEYLRITPISNHWLHSYFEFVHILEYDKESPLVKTVKELYSRMSDSDRQTDIGKKISEYMDLPEAISVGDDMVDGDLYDMDGKLQHISQFKGKYILLDFWSQGCGPCIQSIPELEEIEKMYKDNLVVISINQDSKKQWQKYVKDNQMKGLQWNELKQVSRLAVSYGVTGVPYYALISPEAKVQDMWFGYGPGSLKRKMKEEIK